MTIESDEHGIVVPRVPLYPYPRPRVKLLAMQTMVSFVFQCGPACNAMLNTLLSLESDTRTGPVWDGKHSRADQVLNNTLKVRI